jgi:hypothetical protein
MKILGILSNSAATSKVKLMKPSEISCIIHCPKYIGISKDTSKQLLPPASLLAGLSLSVAKLIESLFPEMFEDLEGKMLSLREYVELDARKPCAESTCSPFFREATGPPVVEDPMYSCSTGDFGLLNPEVIAV